MCRLAWIVRQFFAFELFSQVRMLIDKMFPFEWLSLIFGLCFLGHLSASNGQNHRLLQRNSQLELGWNFWILFNIALLNPWICISHNLKVRINHHVMLQSHSGVLSWNRKFYFWKDKNCGRKLESEYYRWNSLNLKNQQRNLKQINRWNFRHRLF